MDYDSWDALVQYLFKKVGLSFVSCFAFYSLDGVETFSDFSFFFSAAHSLHVHHTHTSPYLFRHKETHGSSPLRRMSPLVSAYV